MAYKSDLLVVSIIIGAFVVTISVADIRVHMADAREESAIGNLFKERGALRLIPWIALVVAILLSGQLMMRMTASSDVPSNLARLCLICHR